MKIAAAITHCVRREVSLQILPKVPALRHFNLFRLGGVSLVIVPLNTPPRARLAPRTLFTFRRSDYAVRVFY